MPTFNPYQRKNKYKAKLTTYNGYTYHSLKEAKYAMNLDWRIKAGEIVNWEKQFKIDLTVNGVHICSYYIDFKIYYLDGRIEYHEVKGCETDVWKIKWKLALALYPEWKFVLIK